MLDDLKNWKRPKVDISKKQVLDYFENNKDQLDPIEGIWITSSSYNFGGKIVTRINTKKVVIMKTNAYQFKVFFYAPLNEGKVVDFGLFEGIIEPTLLENKYKFTEINGPQNIPSSIIQYDITLSKDILVIKESDKPDPQHGSLNIKTEYKYSRFQFPFKPSTENNTNNEFLFSGTGTFISESGLIITNFHVIEDRSDISVYLPQINKEFNADLILKDKNNDLAILRLQEFNFSEIFSNPIPFVISSSSGLKLGEDVFTLGFPLGEILGKTSKFSSGKINSLFGIQDDPRVYQISNPIQPGNSGGPLFNSNGEFIGIVFSSLNAKFFYENANIIPQNVNFAIKSNYLLNLISLLPENDEISERPNLLLSHPIEKQIDLIQPFIVNVKTK